MGEPGCGNAQSSMNESIVHEKGTRGSPQGLSRGETSGRRTSVQCGSTPTHLENCTGKNILQKKSERAEDSSQKRGRMESKHWIPNHLNSLRSEGVVGSLIVRSSEQERRVDARALIADEGRDKLRKAMGSCK